VRGAITKRKALQWDKTGLGLSAEAYPYLAGTGCTMVDGVDDLGEMTDLYAALVRHLDYCVDSSEFAAADD